MSFGEVRTVWALYKPTKTTNFGAILSFGFTKLQISTSLARERYALLRTTLRALLLTPGTGSRSIVQ